MKENIPWIADGSEEIRGEASRFEGTCFLDDTASGEVVGLSLSRRNPHLRFNFLNRKFLIVNFTIKQ